MKLICIEKCFFEGRLWQEGETLPADLADKALKIQANSKRPKFSEKVPEQKPPPNPIIALSQMVEHRPVELNPEEPTPLSQYGKPSKKPLKNVK